MKKIIVFFFIVTALGGQNEYNSINEISKNWMLRNLLDEVLKQI